MSCKWSAKLLPNCSKNVYSVSKTLFVFIFRVREEGTDPRFSPAEDGDCERNLDFIAGMDECGSIGSLERNIEPNP